MALPNNISDRELKKFRGNSESVKVATQIENESSSPVPVTTLGIVWDSIQVTFPANNQDLFTYSYQSQPVLTVLVTYDGASKKQIISLVKEVL